MYLCVFVDDNTRSHQSICNISFFKARISKLEKEEAELEKLRQAKSREAKETADLMREKRKIQAEIKAIQDEKARSELEERKKYVGFF